MALVDEPDKLALLLGGKLPNGDDQQLTPFGMPVGRGLFADPAAGGAAPGGAGDGRPVVPVSPAAGFGWQPETGFQPTPAAGATPSATPGAEDDVAAARPPLPTVPQFEPQPIDQIRATQAAINQRAQPVSYDQNKPHWYDRLLGFGLGTLAGYGNADRGAEVSRDLTFRKYLGKVSQQERDLNPLYKQLEMEEKLTGNINDENQRRQNTFSDTGSNYDRYLRTVEADSTVRQRDPRISYDKDGNPHFFYRRLGGAEYEGPAPANWQNAQRRTEEDKNTPAPGAHRERYIDPETKKPAWRIKTKSGDYMPYEFKSVEEAALAGDDRGTQLYRQAHPGKENAGEKPATRQQSQAVQNKRDRNWAKAKGDYNKALLTLSPTDTEGKKQAQQDYYDRRQEVQDEYEGDVTNLGGTPEHTDLPRNHFGEKESAQPAAAQPAAGTKTVSRSVVEQYARSHKVGTRQMTTDEATQGFQQKGYTVQ